MNDQRPDPDALLDDAKRSSRGKLKVFLGMAPGVGKTFEMMSAAHRQRAAGVDVVAGVIETHGRIETQALLDGLEVLPRAPLEHRGRTLLEFDLDGALARKPELLLVDEYAHSNAPGSRHAKRWQDVAELIGAGINVWTTLNVQHLESLVEVIWRITGVRQRETVPDAALSRADEIELIDITPSELLERLHDGKIYLPDTARHAADNFFKTENLTALRELALRRAAQTVDDQLIGAMRRAGKQGPWAAGERILVLIGPDAGASSLVRAGRRLSDQMMNAPWTVANIVALNAPPAPLDKIQHLADAQKLSAQLGGSILTLTGEDLVDTALEFAHTQNITQIVVGKARRLGWRRIFGESLATALLHRAEGVALHIITDAPQDPRAKPKLKAAPLKFGAKRVAILDYLACLGIVAVTDAAALAAQAVAPRINAGLILLLGVLGAGAKFGVGPSLFAALAAALSYDFYFTEPRWTLAVENPNDIVTLAIFFLAAMIAGSLAGRIHDQARASLDRAARIAGLLAASRSLSAASTKGDAARTLGEQASAALQNRAVVLLAQGDDLVLAAQFPEDEPLSDSDYAAARWAFRKGEPAGRGEDTLPSSALTFRPLEGLKSRPGVIGYRLDSPRDDSMRYLGALIDQAAVALERADLAEIAAEAGALKRSDQLRAALLNSISHDLRTPLSTVLGAATTLIEYDETLKPAVRKDLLDSIREEAERLSRYVGDLLDMTRLEGGALHPRLQPVNVREVADAAADRLSRRLSRRTILRDFPAQISTVEADPGLLEQALVNILENACAYSPDGSTITLSAYEDQASVVIAVDDEGPGVPPEELERIFEKFRRLSDPTDRQKGKGAGLGLAIARGFVEAMGGRVQAASPILPSGGARLAISLKKNLPTHEFLL